MPPDVRVAFVGSWRKASPFGLVLLGDLCCKIYTAYPGSEGLVSNDCQYGYNIFRKAVVGGAYPHTAGQAFLHAFSKLFNLLRYLHGDVVKVFSTDLPQDANDILIFLVGSATHMVIVIKIQGTLVVLKMNTESGKVEPLQSISNFAIFIGHRRCLRVDATKFPGIETNCVYYTEHLGSSAHICKYNIKEKKVERISEAPEFVKQDQQFVLVADRPFTIIQLLCSYTINIPDSQLALQQMS
jgi:hypothetical protein